MADNCFHQNYLSGLELVGPLHFRQEPVHYSDVLLGLLLAILGQVPLTIRHQFVGQPYDEHHHTKDNDQMLVSQLSKTL
jgi:hypothetical protein